MKRLLIENLTFTWSQSDPPLFSDISLNSSESGILTLVGPNGSGKTTLLRIIAGRITPNSGSVSLGSHHVNAELCNYLPQDSSRLLFSHLTLKDNIDVSKETSDKYLYDRIISLLFPRYDTLTLYPTQASGGQRQRAVLARALIEVPQFPLSVFDEPFSQLSYEVRSQLYSEIHSISNSCHRLMVIVSQSIPEAAILGDKLLLLTHGALKVYDTRNITEAANLSAQLLADIEKDFLRSFDQTASDHD